MDKGQEKKGVLERGAAFFEKLHYAIGAVALGGYLLFESATLGAVAVWEGLHGLAWGWIRNRTAKKPKPTPA
jgi:hypothetical protein